MKITDCRHPGTGTVDHLSMAHRHARAGIETTHLPSRGASALLFDLIGRYSSQSIGNIENAAAPTRCQNPAPGSSS